jgi:hypothetical protein
MALDDYFANPSQDCLARLFDAINSMDLSSVPTLNRWEKLIMRSSDRKDLFSEKFAQHQVGAGTTTMTTSNASTTSGGSSSGVKKNNHAPANSVGSFSSFEENILAKSRETTSVAAGDNTPRRPRAGTEASAFGYRPAQNSEMAMSSSSLPSMANHLHQQQQQQLPPLPTTTGGGGGGHSPTDSSFSLDGSAVWVEGDSTDGTVNGDTTTTTSGGANTILGSSAASVMSGSTTTTAVSTRGRSSTDASSASGTSSKNTHYGGGAGGQGGAGGGGGGGSGVMHMDSFSRTMMVRDTHFYQTTISYKEHKIPIILPLTTFMEEVSDVSKCFYPH